LADLLRRYLAEVTPAKSGHAAEARKISRLFKDDINSIRFADLREEFDRVGKSIELEKF
jgi:hypothetical protein